jgi:hypothetical protein
MKTPYKAGQAGHPRALPTTGTRLSHTRVREQRCYLHFFALNGPRQGMEADAWHPCIADQTARKRDESRFLKYAE